MDPNYANFNEIKVRHWRLLSWDEYRRYVLLISSVVLLCSSIIIIIIIIIWATYKNDDSDTRTLSTRDPAENEKNDNSSVLTMYLLNFPFSGEIRSIRNQYFLGFFLGFSMCSL